MRSPWIRRKGLPDDAAIAAIAATCSPTDRTAILLMADAGCRLSEALAYSTTSLSLDASQLRIYATKSRSWRTVPTTARLRSALATLRHVHPFVEYYPRKLQRTLDRVCAQLNLAGITPHRLRHSYATRLAAEGVPIHLICALLGHRSPTTTMVYVHAGSDQILAAATALDRRATAQLPPAQSSAELLRNRDAAVGDRRTLHYRRRHNRLSL